MAKVRFYAKEDQLVVGWPEFIGRKRDADGNFPATQDPVEVESESDVGRKLIKLTRRDGSLWPADESTARLCGVAHQAVEFNGVAWVAKSAVSKAPQKAAAE